MKLKIWEWEIEELMKKVKKSENFFITVELDVCPKYAYLKD